MPTEEARTAINRSVPVCLTTFPNSKDFGILPTQIPLVSVFNGDDHYCGTEPKKPTFKQGTELILEYINQALDVALSLKSSTGDADIISIFTKFVDITNAQTSALSKIFHYGNKDESAMEIPTPSRPQTRTKPGSVTKLHCPCGVLKTSMDELISHIQRRHGESNWYCSYESCEVKCGTKKAQKTHLRNQHFNEFRHWCLYCDYGRDELSNVISHMSSVHTNVKPHSCNLCTSSFSSLQHLKRHQSTCGKKKHLCQYCEKAFMHVKNKDNHEQVIHCKTKEKFKCNMCGKEYSTVQSYKAHYKGYCVRVDEDEHPEEQEDDTLDASQMEVDNN